MGLLPLHTFSTEMQSRFLPLVFTLSSLILSRAQDVIGPGHSCLRWSLDNRGQTRIAFLREEAAAGVRLLYRTKWSDDLRLLTCEVNADPLVTERFRTVCDRSATQDQHVAKRFNIGKLLFSDAPCARVTSSAPKVTRRTRRNVTEGRMRSKRAWTLPGTLWCGQGSEAVKYEQLGMFENTDRCCREHDHCLHIIPPFRVNYGVFNPNFYAVSHCECDRRFRQCLLDVNDTISTMVGYSFFNILRVPCFELKQLRQCTEMYWWGMCKVAKKAPYAVFISSLFYNTSDTKSSVALGDNTESSKPTSEGQHITEKPVIKLNRKSKVKPKHRCGSRDPPRGDTFHQRRRKGKACKRLSAVAASKMPTTSRSYNTTSSTKVGILNVSKSRTLTKNKKEVGKSKSRRQNLSASSKTTTNIYQQTSTTNGTPYLTQKPAVQSHFTADTAVAKSMKTDKKVSKHRHCCRSRMPLAGDSFWPHCKNCLERQTTPRMATVIPEITANSLPKNGTTLLTLQFKKTTTISTPVATKPKTRATSKPQKQMDSYHVQHIKSQEPMGNTLTQSTHAVRSLKQNTALRNMTDNQFVCGSLKHLDECRYKIPPLEKKYDLLNLDSKTAYHCNCTSRLAVQFKSFDQPSTLPLILKDFVSRYCFELPKERKCQHRQSCSGGFTEASNLLRTLKKEEKDTTKVHKSGNNRKRGIPVRLFKRCLRLKRETDIMAQLT